MSALVGATTPPRFHLRTRIAGVTGDNHDRDRMCIRIEYEDGRLFGHLSLSIAELHQLSAMVSDYEPTLAASWAKRDGQR